ncbi:MAG: hypothetical protein V7K89_08905 [Nostoc sp.]|uniref:hypothetical protein n=1 Tax=Nostoc sp. TaxID=1180 RepID=UPI002FF44C6D
MPTRIIEIWLYHNFPGSQLAFLLALHPLIHKGYQCDRHKPEITQKSGILWNAEFESWQFS